MARFGKRTLIGCGVGCGALLIIVIGLSVAFSAWIRGAGEQLEPRRLLGNDTTGYLEWTLHEEDPGTDRFLELVIETIDAQQSGRTKKLPLNLSWLNDRQTRELDEDLREMLPIVLAWTLASAPETERQREVYSINPTGLGNRVAFIDWIFGWIARFSDEIEVEHYEGEKLYRMETDTDSRRVFFARRGTVFVTTDFEAARIAIERLKIEQAGLREATRLDRLFDETSSEATLRGAVSNRRNELDPIWGAISGGVGDELLRSVNGVTLDGGLQQDGSLALTLRLHGADREWAESNAAELGAAIEQGLEWMELEPQVTAQPEGDVVRVNIRVEDPVGRLGELVDEQ